MHKRMEMEGEPQRRRGVCCKILLCNPFSVAGVLLKMEEKNSFAISALCPEGPGLPQSQHSVLFLPSVRVAKQMM